MLYKRFHLIAIILGVLITANAYSQAELPPIKIGASIALTGKLSAIGKAEQAGLSLAIKEVNQQGGINGRKLQLVLDDNQGEARIAVSSVRKLLEQDGVNVLFTAFTHIITAAADIAKHSNTVTLYHASTAAPAKANERIFREYGDAETSGVAIAKYLSSVGVRSVSFLAENGDVCLLNEKGFRSEARKAGITIRTLETFNTGDNDFRPLLLRIKQTNPEWLVLCTWRDTALVTRQMKELGLIGIPSAHFHAPFLPASDTQEIRSFFEQNKGLSTWYGFTRTDTNDAQKEFIKRFSKEFGEDPLLPDSAFAYDDIFIITEALKLCTQPTTVDQACLAQKLLQTKYKGISGDIQFDKNRLSQREVILIQVVSGNWRRLDW